MISTLQGGKSPTIVDDTCDLHMAARRIAWGKWINAGQSCIAPDYVMVQENVRAVLSLSVCLSVCLSGTHLAWNERQVEKQFIEEVQKALKDFFGADAQKSESYGRIVANRHWKRLVGLMQPDAVICGGKTDEADLYIEPTLVRATASDRIMEDEVRTSAAFKQTRTLTIARRVHRSLALFCPS